MMHKVRRVVHRDKHGQMKVYYLGVEKTTTAVLKSSYQYRITKWLFGICPTQHAVECSKAVNMLDT